MNNFLPFDGNTVSITAGTSSSSVQIITLPARQDTFFDGILVSNSGSGVVFVKFSSTAAPVATVADTPVLPGSAILIQAGNSPTFVAAIALAAGNVVYFTPGYGN